MGVRSASWWGKANRMFPGGVNSPVRAFGAVGGTPIFVKAARGPYLTDVDGRRFIDLVGSWGPMVLGHGHPRVVEAVRRQVRQGMSFGAPHRLEVELAARVQKGFPSMEQLRFVSSGTEATMSALRVARAVTGRAKIIKCEGCYHGHVDALLVKAGSGVATLGMSSSAGVPAHWAKDTVVVPYNNVEACEAAFKKWPRDIAAMIVEPVAANMGVVLPQPGYLEGLRGLANRYGAVLIFDEVISGFRLGFGGAQEVYGVKPDLTCLGKIIGGGLPVGAYGGKASLMKWVAPRGPVYQAGTLSGNPAAMAAGIATLTLLDRERPYGRLDEMGRALQEGLEQGIREAGITACVARAGSLLTLFFLDRPPRHYQEVIKANTRRFRRYFHKMLNQGIYLPPSSFEAWFLSVAHTPQLVKRIIAAHNISLK